MTKGCGTHNALLGLGEGMYLEILARDPDQRAPPRSWLGVDSVVATGRPRITAWAVAPVPEDRDCEDGPGHPARALLENAVRDAAASGYNPGLTVEDFERETTGGGVVLASGATGAEAHLEVIKALIEANATVNLAKEDGTTPLFISSLYGKLTMLRWHLAVDTHYGPPLPPHPAPFGIDQCRPLPGGGIVPFLIAWCDDVATHTLPAYSAPSGCTVESLRARHPCPCPGVVGAMGALGVTELAVDEFDSDWDEARTPSPGLTLTLNTPNGIVDLC